MPCCFAASLGVHHIRLLVDTIAAIGHEFATQKKAELVTPVLVRLTPPEQQSLILAVATAIILGGHLEHTVRPHTPRALHTWSCCGRSHYGLLHQILTEATLYAIYMKAGCIAMDPTSSHCTQIRADLYHAALEEIPAGTNIARVANARQLGLEKWIARQGTDDSIMPYSGVVDMLMHIRFGSDLSEKGTAFKTRTAIVHSRTLSETYGRAYLEPEPLVFSEEDVQRVLYLTQLIAKPRAGDAELVSKVRGPLSQLIWVSPRLDAHGEGGVWFDSSPVSRSFWRGWRSC